MTACIQGEPPLLLPNQKATVGIHVSGMADGRNSMKMEFEGMIGEFGVLISPVSQNFVGEATALDWRDYTTRWKVVREMERICPS